MASLLGAQALFAAPLAEPAPPAPVQGRQGVWGSFHVAFEPAPDPIPLNELFRLAVTVRDGDGRPLPGVELAVSAVMPEHRHGTNLEPKVRRLAEGEEGRFEVEGLLFHMPGRWWIRMDLRRGEETAQAVFEVMLD